MCGPFTELVVNGERRQIDEGMTLSDLVAQLKLVSQQVAVEVNRQIVPRSEHSRWRLKAGDQLEIVSLAGGG